MRHTVNFMIFNHGIFFGSFFQEMKLIFPWQDLTWPVEKHIAGEDEPDSRVENHKLLTTTLVFG